MNVSRRQFIKNIGLAGVLAIPACHRTQNKFRDKPNIIYFLADDMGYGDVSCLNKNSRIPTPNMDRLAAQGVICTDAHSPAAVCTPTRYGVLTGRYAWRTRLKNGVLWPWDPPLIEPDRMTVPAFLRQNGYKTSMFGKWHLGWDWPVKEGEPLSKNETGEIVDFTQPIRKGPTDNGFDYYFGVDVPNFPPYCYIENDKTVGIPTEIKPKDMYGWNGVMLPGWNLVDILPDITQKAVEYIDQNSDSSSNKPFFMYFCSTAPHTPIAPAPEFVGKSQAGKYGDFVYQVDHSIGQLMDALERNGMAENTFIIVTSDNGSPSRIHSRAKPRTVLEKYNHNSSYIFRGMKADVWDGGHRIPFIARWPQQIPAGSTCDETICLTDLMATCAALTGMSLSENTGEDSYNILPALLGQKRDKPIREATVHHSGGGMFAIRQGKWKLVAGLGSGGWSQPRMNEIEPVPDGPEGQLYDMKNDPEEKNNLWLEKTDVVEHLLSLLEKYKNTGYSAPVNRK